MTNKKERESINFETGTDLGKGKQEPTLLSAHHVHIANLVMHFGMKPFPLKSLPRKYGQSS